MKFERRRDSHGLRSQPERNAAPRITALLVSVKLFIIIVTVIITRAEPQRLEATRTERRQESSLWSFLLERRERGCEQTWRQRLHLHS